MRYHPAHTESNPMKSTYAAVLAAVCTASLLLAPVARAQKVIQIPIRTDGPKSLDPAHGSTQYDDQAICQIYETLLQWKYLVRPLTLEPLLLAEMPKDTVNADGTQTWRCILRKGIKFQDDPCFPDGKGRELTVDDVFYSWKRLADPENLYESIRFFDGVLVGFTEYMNEQKKLVGSGKPFDYTAPVAGLKKVNDYEFEITLTKPVYRFMYNLAQFQLSIVPREAVEKYKTEFATHPVGTGPFICRPGDWQPGQRMILHRNPNYREEKYPSELPADPALAKRDRELGFDKPAGVKLPIVDRVEISFYVEDQPMWLDFNSNKLGFTQVPTEYFDKAFVRRTQKLREEYAAKGIVSHADPLLDFIFRGFNMEDPLVGGYSEEKKALRQALALAFDPQEMNQNFYNGLNSIYDGPIPPGLDGHPKNGEAPISFRGPDIEEAKSLLAKAGYPGGKDKDGKQLVIDYYTSRGGNQAEQMQAEQRFAERIGVKLNPRMLDFSELDEACKKKKAQMFGYAWGSDYPDAENNLMLFYSGAVSPGPNSFNYSRKEYDELYERSLVMKPGPERTRIFEEMRDMIIEDCPAYGSMGRTRYYLVQPWLKNFKPTENFHNWLKYLDVDESKRN
jgi:oligopeptide transport system substrate-binding protein